MWSWELICAELVIILICRGISTIGLFGLIKLMGYEKNHSHPLTLRDMGFLFYSGLMRGAIALGLVLRIQSDFANREVIVTTCLALVVFTTIFFGSTTALVGKLFLP